jgi:uncharacterized membrane protein (Fun14 family)
LSIENVVFSAGGGFLFGAVAGYAIEKVMKIAAIVIGLFVLGLSYLSYKGWINVKWMEMENATKATLTKNCAYVHGNPITAPSNKGAAANQARDTNLAVAMANLLEGLDFLGGERRNY